MKTVRFLRAAMLAALCVSGTFAHGAETLMYRDPALLRFAVGHEQRQGAHSIVEWVPEGEGVQDWSRMITLNTAPPMPVADFYRNMDGLWRQACPGGSSVPIRDGEENGYPFVFWMQVCPDNPATGKPEFTWMKAVSGRERLFVAQYAFRYEPSVAEVRAVAEWMRDVHVAVEK